MAARGRTLAAGDRAALISGTLLFLAVAAPWYLLAERATPGFLRYFLINENFLRYLTNDYGDYYGYGRLRPYGSIWLMFLLVLLPWTVLAIALLARSAKSCARGRPSATSAAAILGSPTS